MIDACCRGLWKEILVTSFGKGMIEGKIAQACIMILGEWREAMFKRMR